MFWFYILKLQDAHIRCLFFTVLSDIAWSKWFLVDRCYIVFNFLLLSLLEIFLFVGSYFCQKAFLSYRFSITYQHHWEKKFWKLQHQLNLVRIDFQIMRNDSIHSKPVWKKNIVLVIVKHSIYIFKCNNESITKKYWSIRCCIKVIRVNSYWHIYWWLWTYQMMYCFYWWIWTSTRLQWRFWNNLSNSKACK